YGRETKDIEKKAREYTDEAEKYQKASVHMHHLRDRYDIAELGVEMGLVVCSLAGLNQRRGFLCGGAGFRARGVGGVECGVLGEVGGLRRGGGFWCGGRAFGAGGGVLMMPGVGEQWLPPPHGAARGGDNFPGSPGPFPVAGGRAPLLCWRVGNVPRAEDVS